MPGYGVGYYAILRHYAIITLPYAIIDAHISADCRH
jgi:hypothetical protein